MKAWEVKAFLKHKKCERYYTTSFFVVNDGEDPIATILGQEDFSGVIYLRGEVKEIETPYVHCIDIKEEQK